MRNDTEPDCGATHVNVALVIALYPLLCVMLGNATYAVTTHPPDSDQPKQHIHRLLRTATESHAHSQHGPLCPVDPAFRLPIADDPSVTRYPWNAVDDGLVKSTAHNQTSIHK